MSDSDRVSNLLRDNYELDQLYKSLDSEWTRQDFTDFLDKVLDNHDTLFGPDASPDFDHMDLDSFNATARSLAKRYVDQPSWHTPWLTRYLLVDVLEGQCTYLAWFSDKGLYPDWSLRRTLPSPYRKFIPPLLSLAILALYLWLLYWLATKDHLIVAALLGAFLLYFYLIEKPITWWRRRKGKIHFVKLAQLLVTPLHEIRSANYDSDTISRRLQACEQKDLQVASIVFALLKLPPRTQPASPADTE